MVFNMSSEIDTDVRVGVCVCTDMFPSSVHLKGLEAMIVQ